MFISASRHLTSPVPTPFPVQSPCYTVPLLGFIDEKCIVFDSEEVCAKPCCPFVSS